MAYGLLEGLLGCLVALRWGAVNSSQHGRNLVRNNGKKNQWFLSSCLAFKRGLDDRILRSLRDFNVNFRLKL